jgi:hypothetical protein
VPQLLNSLTQVLHLVEVLPSHSVPLVVLGDGVATCEHREWHVGIVPQKELYFPPPVHRFGHVEVEVGINSMPRFDIDVHAAQNRCFHARALREPDANKVIPQIKVRINPHVGLA